MCQTSIILLRTGPQNNARLKPVRSAKKVAVPCSKGLAAGSTVYISAFQTFLCYGTIIHSEFGCDTCFETNSLSWDEKYKVLSKHKTFAAHQCAAAHNLGNTGLHPWQIDAQIPTEEQVACFHFQPSLISHDLVWSQDCQRSLRTVGRDVLLGLLPPTVTLSWRKVGSVLNIGGIRLLWLCRLTSYA